MNVNSPAELSEVFKRYALGLARGDGLPPGEEPLLKKRRSLLAKLARLGVQGWPERGTLYTRSLPSGCKPCLKGEGSNLALTTLCNRDCFFCFNPKPRADAMSVHGRAVASEDEIAGVVEKYGIRSLGLSGGEPLLKPARVFRIIEKLRARFGRDLRIDLYTNGDRLTQGLIARLREAGLDGMRINLAAGGYQLAAVRLALREMHDVEVEIPVIPQHRKRLKRLVDELDDLGAPHLILHELFASAQNVDSLRALGYQGTEDSFDKLTWSGVLDSDAAALETVAYALQVTRTLSVYYCSCATQQWIGEQALSRSATSRA